jgi:LEA14-like dessication related protein
MIPQKMNRFWSMLFIAGVFLFPTSCAYLKQLSALKQCEFRYGTLENPALAGVNIQDLKDISDFGLNDMSLIAQSIFHGKLPLTFTIYVEVQNPNTEIASMNKLEYIAFIDEAQIAEGEVNKRIEIPAGGIASVPIEIQTDIIEILHKEPRNALINFALNLADASKKPTRVGLKIKPYIRIREKDLVYPGYIRIRQEFGAEGN